MKGTKWIKCESPGCERKATADVEVDVDRHWNVCVEHAQAFECAGLIVEWWSWA